MWDFIGFLRTNVVGALLLVLGAALFIVDAIGRAQSVIDLPHWAWQIGAVVLFIAAILSILYHQHRRIESFKPGPLPPAADPATTLLANLLAQLIYLRDIRKNFEDRFAKSEERWTAFLTAVAAIKPDSSPILVTAWKRAYNAWLAEVRAMQKYASDSIGFKRDFLDSTVFQKNPGVVVANDQNLGTEADKFELRRAYCEHNSCIGGSVGFRSLLDIKENTRRAALNAAAKPSVEEKV